MEIEKKYTIKELPEHLEQYKHRVIEQGYLCSKPTIRIRKSITKEVKENKEIEEIEEYVLTYKSKIGLENIDNDICINNEIEVLLTKEGYYHLKEKIDNNMIEKTRYNIPLDNGLMVELDIFSGVLEGLIFAEVEFLNANLAKEFIPPIWFDKDVSANKHYSNYYLSTVEKLER